MTVEWVEVFKGKNLVCEARVAKTPGEKAWGWMFHYPHSKEGLLMKYDSYHTPSIWMPFMRTPISIAFIDKNFKIVDIQKAVPIGVHPKTWKVHFPKKKAQYVLELHPSIELKVGDKLTFKKRRTEKWEWLGTKRKPINALP